MKRHPIYPSMISELHLQFFLTFKFRNCTIVPACSMTQECPTLCDPVHCSPRGSSVHGIFQARIPEWVAISYTRDLSDPGTKTGFHTFPALAGGFFTTESPGKPQHVL